MKGFLDAAEQVNERYRNMANTYLKLNRVISGRHDLQVELADDMKMDAPAWSDGMTVTFNRPKIGNISTIQDIVELTGLNYHELSHIMFTPRRTSYFYSELAKTTAVMQQQRFAAANILEDQRIETLMTGLYPAVAPYFRSMFMKWCLADQSSWSTNHPLAHGRHYLPLEVREEFANRFVAPHLTEAFSNIIDEYRMLTLSSSDKYTKNAARAAKLVIEFVGLQHQIQSQFGDPHGHSARGNQAPTQGEQDTVEEQKEAKEWAQWYEESDDDATEEDGSEEEGSEAGRSGRDSDADDSEDDEDFEESGDSDGGSESGDDGDDDSDGEPESGSDSGDGSEDVDGSSDSGEHDGSGSDDADGEQKHGGSESGTSDSDAGSESSSTGSGTGSSEGEDGTSAGSADETSETRSGAGSGAGTGKGTPKSVREFTELLEDAIEEVLTDSSIVKDAKEKREQFKKGDGTTRSEIIEADWMDHPVAPLYKTASSKFQRALEQLTADADPGWKTHQSSGKINIQRAMNGSDLEDLYDRWDEGVNDATDIECVVLVDGSGSMKNITHKSMQAMWAIKRAMDGMKASTTVYEYDTGAALLFSAQEKAIPTKYRHSFLEGGTNPKIALDETMRVFYNSKRSHKICIIVTDGHWGYPEPSEELIERMNTLGVTTALAYLDNGYAEGSVYAGAGRGNTHKCQVYGEVHDAADLIPFAKNIVTSVMRRRG
jgi:hypothetical protein